MDIDINCFKLIRIEFYWIKIRWIIQILLDQTSRYARLRPRTLMAMPPGMMSHCRGRPRRRKLCALPCAVPPSAPAPPGHADCRPVPLRLRWDPRARRTPIHGSCWPWPWPDRTFPICPMGQQRWLRRRLRWCGRKHTTLQSLSHGECSSAARMGFSMVVE